MKKITPELLLDLGAKETGPNESTITSRGHLFRFVFCNDKFTGYQIKFYIEDHPNFHYVSDLEDCFGFIADHFFFEGKNAAKKELKDWLKEEN